MRISSCLPVATAVCGVAFAAPAPAPIPMRDFFRNPEKSAFEISPDGKTVSFMQAYKSRLNVFVQPRAGGAPTRVTDETERDIAGYFWKGNDHLLYLKDYKGDENFHLVSVGKDGNGLKDLTPFPKVRAEIIDDLEDHPTDILVGLNRRNPEVFDAYRLNAVTGVLKLVAENPGNITSWVTDHAGMIRVAVTTDGVNTSLLYRANESAPWKTFLTTNFKEQVSPLFFTFDDKKLYAASNLKRDKSAIVVVDPATGKEDKVVFEHPEVDVAGLEQSKKRKVLTLAAFTTWRQEHHFFDPATEALYQKLEARLPGYQIDLQSHDKAEETFIVAAHNDRTRGTRYLYDAPADKLTKLGDVSSWLDEKRMAEMKPLSYTTRDGLKINGYLTLPLGKAAKGLPLIVNPHGGPWVRDEWGFNPEVQFLASRGYAVLQVNYRGSTGYGRKFWESSFKQWGKKMQDDVSDGVRHVVGEGIVDPKRVCIYGGSYGGYATLAGLAFSPELYACGIDYVGVSNLFTFMKTIPPYWKPYLAMMHEMVGDPEKDKELLTSASPVFHVDKIRAPLFIAQGAQDPRVNIAESNQMVAALKKRGIDVPYLVKDNEGHGFHNEENRFDFYEAMEKFLAKHLH
jgi:dipeptidyl aminopeptidase/acylaminoacyl peptidase